MLLGQSGRPNSPPLGVRRESAWGWAGIVQDLGADVDSGHRRAPPFAPYDAKSPPDRAAHERQSQMDGRRPAAGAQNPAYRSARPPPTLVTCATAGAPRTTSDPYQRVREHSPPTNARLGGLTARIRAVRHRLSQALGEQAWRESGTRRPGRHRRPHQKIIYLGQQVTDLKLQLGDATRTSPRPGPPTASSWPSLTHRTPPVTRQRRRSTTPVARAQATPIKR